MKEKQKTNRVLTIVLILGTVTVFFPLYMAAIIAFKKPSEMTNDVACLCIFPAVVLYIFLQISSGIFLYNAHDACAGSGFRFPFFIPFLSCPGTAPLTICKAKLYMRLRRYCLQSNL